jgi:hypothetical protein
MAMLGLSEWKFIGGMDGLEKEEGESGRVGEWESGGVGSGKGNAVKSMVSGIENVRSH